MESFLIGGLEHGFYFPLWDVILPIDELIFFKMVIAPPTRFEIFDGNIGISWYICYLIWVMK
jgi:hypothetical protein